MFIALVDVHVKPGYEDAFKDIIRANHLGTIQEPGCLRFDVAQSVDDPTRFALWEWYIDAEAAAAHKETPHYAVFKADAAEMMAEPRASTRFDGLFPESGAHPR